MTLKEERAATSAAQLVLASLASKEIYNSANNPWTNGPSSSVQRYGHSATLLANGKVLVAGGTTAYATYAQADLYDPAVKPNGRLHGDC